MKRLLSGLLVTTLSLGFVNGAMASVCSEEEVLTTLRSIFLQNALATEGIKQMDLIDAQMRQMTEEDRTAYPKLVKAYQTFKEFNDLTRFSDKDAIMKLGEDGNTVKCKIVKSGIAIEYDVDVTDNGQYFVTVSNTNQKAAGIKLGMIFATAALVEEAKNIETQAKAEPQSTPAPTPAPDPVAPAQQSPAAPDKLSPLEMIRHGISGYDADGKPIYAHTAGGEGPVPPVPPTRPKARPLTPSEP
jgi:hypothetical protein